jgi:hypothetical protein
VLDLVGCEIEKKTKRERDCSMLRLKEHYLWAGWSSPEKRQNTRTGGATIVILHHRTLLIELDGTELKSLKIQL